MRINRLYTIKGQDVFATKTYKYIESIIRAADGKIISKFDNIEMPTDWSQNACDIFALKYLRKAGVPIKLKKVKEDNVPLWLCCSINESTDGEVGMENSIKQVLTRIAGCWTYHGWKGGYFSSEDDALAFFDEHCYMLLHQICAPNSPQWFNTGLHWAYGIEGPGCGHYHFDPKTNSIVASQTAYKHPQVHACFILNVEDHLLGDNGIMDNWTREAAIFKYGSGSGTNFSNIRGVGEKLSGGGKSSGLLSFLKIGDTSASAIKSGGTTRRAAKMVILNDDHPDVEEFINWKVTEEQYVLSLVTGSKLTKKHLENIEQACNKWYDDETKYDIKTNTYLSIAVDNALKAGIALSYCKQVLHMLENNIPVDFQELTYHWDSQAYKIVSGKSSNNSIRVTDKLIEAVKNNQMWNLTARTDGSIVKTIPARDLWKQICYSAWACADPGVQFDDTIQSWHTCKKSGRINASNPCSEYLFLDNTACNLASINLDKMLINMQGKMEFDITGFQHACRLLTVALEISVYMAQYPTYDVAMRSYQFRTLGLGYASLGSLLMSLGLAYDSDQGRCVAAAITSLMTWTSYECSADMAKELGAFSEYQLNKESMMQVLYNMKNATDGITLQKNDAKKQIQDDNDQEPNEYIEASFAKLNMVDTQADPRFASLNVLPYHLEAHNCILKDVAQVARALANTVMEKVTKYGVRNAQTTVIAPTGTISFVMECGTTSCEPTFSLVTWKNLSGGGDIRVINSAVLNALHYLKYTPEQVDKMKAYLFGHGNIHNAPHINDDSLMQKGFTPEMIKKINVSLQNAYQLEHIINASFLHSELEKTAPELVGSKNLLKQLDFSAAQIQEANLYCCGHLTMEGAPGLKEEHLSIFDCAVNNGVGVRSIEPIGHVKMVAAIQPFISGASSKTVNMLEEATIETISDIYLQAWAMGVKCISLYRSNSKFSQPINVTEFSQNTEQVGLGSACRYGMRIDNTAFYILAQENSDGSLAELEIVMGKEGSSFRILMDCFAQAISLGLKYNIPIRKYVEAFKNTTFEPAGLVHGYDGVSNALSPLDLLAKVLEKEYSSKEQYKKYHKTIDLEQRCHSKRITITIEGHQFTLHTGQTADGQLGEVFFKMSKEGSAFCSLMSNFAKAVSIALQSGVPFVEIYNTFIGTKFEPNGFIQGHPQIRYAESIIDFAFKCLANWYHPELLEWSQKSAPHFDVKTTVSSAAKNSNTMENIQSGSERPCAKCFSFKLKSNGTCWVCENCGETTGCS